MTEQKGLEQLAADAFPFDGSDPRTVVECRRRVVMAIKADRAQRDPNADGTLHGAAIIALNERSYHAGDTPEGWSASDAAGWVEANPDEFWDRYAGPMIDQIERDAKGGGMS